MNLNQAVFTTKYVIQENKPILYVICDEDGEWQFLGGQDVTMEDMMIVSLKEMIDHDQTIKDVLDLNSNSEARREKVGEPWIITSV